MTKNEFIRWLEKKDACKEGLDWANAQESAQDILAKLERQDWLVWLVHAVGGLAWAEYERVKGPAWAEYERTRGPALAEYYRVTGLAWAEYYRVTGLAAKKALTWKRVVEAVLKKA